MYISGITGEKYTPFVIVYPLEKCATDFVGNSFCAIKMYQLIYKCILENSTIYFADTIKWSIQTTVSISMIIFCFSEHIILSYSVFS